MTEKKVEDKVEVAAEALPEGTDPVLLANALRFERAKNKVLLDEVKPAFPMEQDSTIVTMRKLMQENILRLKRNTVRVEETVELRCKALQQRVLRARNRRRSHSIRVPLCSVVFRLP